MSSVVRLNVPPFAPAPPTSLAALRRPLVDEESARCESRCQLCETCEAARKAEIDAAKTLADTTALRLSQLVEDGLAKHVSRMEAEQSRLVTAVLQAVLPHLANASLRAALEEELRKSVDPLKDLTVRLAKPPSLEIGNIPADMRLTLEEDDSLQGNVVELRIDGGATRLDADALVAACLSRLNTPET